MSLRALLIAAIVLGACFLSTTFSEHHTGSNAEPFTLLYQHVQPAMLVSGTPAADEHSHEQGGEHSDEHAETPADDHAPAHPPAEPLFAVTLSSSHSALDGDGNPDNGTQIVATNLQIFQLAAVLLIFIAFSGVPTYLRTGKGDAVSRLLTGFCMWIKDEVVLPVMGKKDGERFLPLFLCIFFFILFMNLMGLVPGSATATANVFVTAGLAVVTLCVMIGAGMAAQGPLAFWKNLVPHVPGWLWPMMFVIEVMGLLIKPFALTIRLFANMMGGHLVVLSFLGLIFFFAGVEHGMIGWFVSPAAVGFAVFIMIIEAFVALLQAYIFTQLSVIFVGASIHPEH